METRKVSKSTSSIVMILLVLILSVGISVLKVDIQVLLLIGLVLTIGVVMKLGYSFDEVVKKMKAGIQRAFTALCIFILIGALIGTWIQAGIVPTLIYYGLKTISIKYFLPIGLIICSITSLATGTSWGTCGTIGVAFMAMGLSLGIPAPVVAGMIVSGAFFGDKISPLSDTTNLAAVSADTDLYKHIKSMLFTTVPSYIIALIGFTLLGFKYAEGTLNMEIVNEIMTTLNNNFNINILLLIPVAVVLYLSIKRVDAIISIGCGVALGVLFSVIFQSNGIAAALNAINYGYESHTGLKLVDELLTRGGIQSMMWTFSLSFIALALGSVLEGFGFLQVLLKDLIMRVKKIGSLAVLVIGTCFFTNVVMCEIYLSIILNGSIYKNTFKERGLDESMLSRFLEEGSTLTGALVPWTTAGAFVSGVLGISVIDYAPYALLNIINPIISILFAYLGIAIIKKKTVKSETQSIIV